MKRLIIAVIFYLFSTHNILADEVGIVAIVDDAVISTTDVHDRMHLVTTSSEVSLTNELEQQLFPRILQSLVDERLYAQEASRLNLVVSEGEVERALRTIEVKNNLKQGQIDGWLRKRGVAKPSLVRQIKSQLLWTKIVNRKIRPRIKISDIEIKESMEHLSSGGGEKELLISEIALPVASSEDKEKIRKKTAGLVKEIRKGRPYEEVARSASASPTSVNGGKIGWVRSTSFPPELAEEMAGLEEGRITDPVLTGKGYYIIKLHRKRDAFTPLQYETEVMLKQVFKPLGASHSENISKLAALAGDIKSCKAFDKVIVKAIPDASVEPLALKIKDLDPELQESVLKQAVDTTLVTQSSTGIHLFTMCERNQPVSLEITPSDEAKIKDRLLQQRTEMQPKHYLRDLRRQALIEIREK